MLHRVPQTVQTKWRSSAGRSSLLGLHRRKHICHRIAALHPPTPTPHPIPRPIPRSRRSRSCTPFQTTCPCPPAKCSAWPPPSAAGHLTASTAPSLVHVSMLQAATSHALSWVYDTCVWAAGRVMGRSDEGQLRAQQLAAGGRPPACGAARPALGASDNLGHLAPSKPCCLQRWAPMLPKKCRRRHSATAACWRERASKRSHDDAPQSATRRDDCLEACPAVLCTARLNMALDMHTSSQWAGGCCNCNTYRPCSVLPRSLRKFSAMRRP